MHATSMRRTSLFAGILAVTLGLSLQGVVRAASEAYQKALAGTGFVVATQSGKNANVATCWLVDRERQLAITNEHVVADAAQIKVYFPLYQDGKVITQSAPYVASRQPILGRVLARDVKRDLALIRLSSVPRGVRALPLASRGVNVGQAVHSVGNSGMAGMALNKGSLWKYRYGEVRLAGFAAFKPVNAPQTEARIVLTSSLTTPGDSGGPLVDDSGCVVGIVHGVNHKANVGLSIDLEEIKEFLRRALSSDEGPAKSAVAGTWTAMMSQGEEQRPVGMTFRADGTFQFDAGPIRFEGTYSCTDNVLKLQCSEFKGAEECRLSWDGSDRFSFTSGKIKFACTRR